MENNKQGIPINVDDLHEYAQGIIDTMRDPFLVLGGDLRVILASKSFYKIFQVDVQETENRLIYDLGNGQWNIPKLRELLEDIIPNSVSFDDFKVEHDFLKIGKRVMILNARRIPRPPEKPKVILLSIEDITGINMLDELHDKVKDLERFTKVATGREERIIELKEKVNELEAEIIKIRKVSL
jgi:two-component system CheB/CheR fusion protein